MDELFDDPIRKYLKAEKSKEDDDPMMFNKSKKGLGEIYENDFRKKILEKDPSAYLTNDLTGPEGQVKREIDDLMKNLFY